MQVPLFSVVTVSFNRGYELEATLNSVTRQTARARAEYLVIDALSTDATADILTRRAAEIDVCVREPDRGIYDGMNKALRVARGEWVVFLNAGDSFASPRVLEATAEVAGHAGSRAELLFGNVILESADGTRRQLCRYPNLSHRFLYRRTVCHQVIFAHRRLLARTGGFCLSYPVCADFDWLCRAVYAHRGQVVRTGIPTAVFRLDGRSSKQYSMHERFEILLRHMPTLPLLALGGLDIACRAFGGVAGKAPDGGAKKIGPWLRRGLDALLGEPTRNPSSGTRAESRSEADT